MPTAPPRAVYQLDCVSMFRELTVGVRLWSNVLLESSEDTNLVCEPQLHIHSGHVQGLLGALLPIINRPEAPTGLAGLRVAAAALF